jgi:Predicted membrane protein (DUF2101)
VVAVSTVRVMKMSAHHVIEVIAVWGAFVPAVWAVSVLLIMPFTFMLGRTFLRIGTAHGYRVFVDVAVMQMMQVTVVKIVRMPLVNDSHVPATGTMLVTVLGVLCALTFFHISPFDRDYVYDNAREKKREPIRVSPRFPKLISGRAARAE